MSSGVPFIIVQLMLWALTSGYSKTEAVALSVCLFSWRTLIFWARTPPLPLPPLPSPPSSSPLLPPFSFFKFCSFFFNLRVEGKEPGIKQTLRSEE